MRLRTPVDPVRDHIRGPADAKLSIVEYADFECPYSGEAYWVLEQVRRHFGSSLQFVFRHFPLFEVHPCSVSAAEVAEAANAEDKFWHMHALLFENQDALSYGNLLGYCSAIDLDVDRVADALDAHIYLPRIREDFYNGVRNGVDATPALFVNGARYEGPRDVSALVAALEWAQHELPLNV
jgi:protein-disulfide isomerase